MHDSAVSAMLSDFQSELSRVVNISRHDHERVQSTKGKHKPSFPCCLAPELRSLGVRQCTNYKTPQNKHFGGDSCVTFP